MKQNNTAKLIALASAFAFEIVVLIGGMFLLGRFLDTKLHTNPLFTVTLAFAAIVIGVIRLIKRANDMEDDDG
ncbi:MAG: AtpZ/AtpI family protein [Candidatus Izimaplasma sp.]|nr:AtpZ/AtpI family protein [Candidatus Izimaplasma bacterium]